MRNPDSPSVEMPETTTIREIRRSEYGFLKEMLYEAVYIPEGKERPSRALLEEPHVARYFENFGRDGDVALVLDSHGELVGATWVRLLCENAKGYGFVDDATPELSLAIRPAFRGRGFGTQMLDLIFERLRGQGVKQISLSSDKRNPAVRLYQRCGFELVAEKGDGLTMLKKL